MALLGLEDWLLGRQKDASHHIIMVYGCQSASKRLDWLVGLQRVACCELPDSTKNLHH
jgi:hypothetical protein